MTNVVLQKLPNGRIIERAFKSPIVSDRLADRQVALELASQPSWLTWQEPDGFGRHILLYDRTVRCGGPLVVVTEKSPAAFRGLVEAFEAALKQRAPNDPEPVRNSQIIDALLDAGGIEDKPAEFLLRRGPSIVPRQDPLPPLDVGDRSASPAVDQVEAERASLRAHRDALAAMFKADGIEVDLVEPDPSVELDDPGKRYSRDEEDANRRFFQRYGIVYETYLERMWEREFGVGARRPPKLER